MKLAILSQVEYSYGWPQGSDGVLTAQYPAQLYLGTKTHLHSCSFTILQQFLYPNAAKTSLKSSFLVRVKDQRTQFGY